MVLCDFVFFIILCDSSLYTLARGNRYKAVYINLSVISPDLGCSRVRTNTNSHNSKTARGRAAGIARPAPPKALWNRLPREVVGCVGAVHLDVAVDFAGVLRAVGVVVTRNG